MKIELHPIRVSDLVAGYVDDAEEGVIAFGGRLDVRPKYQREFVYKDAQRNAVIETLRKGFPLNVMYWVKKSDGNYEVLDGQQRTISICEYVTGAYSINEQYYHTLTSDQREQIDNYELMVYFCEGTDSEKLAWFNVVNIAGEKLTPQELLNATYTGPWLSDAKRVFSKTGGPAFGLGHKYLKGTPIRQDYLETALSWISHGNVRQYMADHQLDENASPLWQYFQQVIHWVQMLFPTYRKEMQGLPWGEWFNTYGTQAYNAQQLETEVQRLMEDVDVTKKSGIYLYLLSGEEKHLNIRAFDKRMARSVYERQKGVCPHCKKQFALEEMEADHITPWHEGGKTELDNCQMLCRTCNRKKGGR